MVSRISSINSISVIFLIHEKCHWCKHIYIYLDLPRGAEWIIRSAYTPSLRVQTTPFGRCWYIFYIYIYIFIYLFIYFCWSSFSSTSDSQKFWKPRQGLGCESEHLRIGGSQQPSRHRDKRDPFGLRGVFLLYQKMIPPKKVGLKCLWCDSKCFFSTSLGSIVVKNFYWLKGACLFVWFWSEFIQNLNQSKWATRVCCYSSM